MFYLLAQTPPAMDPASATAWATGSAAVLLGLVLYWLAFHYLPAKDKQTADIMTMQNNRLDAKDAQMTKVCETNANTFKEVALTFAGELREERRHREKMAESFQCRNYEPRPQH